MHKKFEKIGEKRKRQKEDFERALVREREKERKKERNARRAEDARTTTTNGEELCGSRVVVV